MLEYRTKDGDRLDQICHKHYGDVQTVTAVLEANPGLAKQPPILPAGLVIKLPEIEQPSEFDNAGEAVWD